MTRGLEAQPRAGFRVRAPGDVLEDKVPEADRFYSYGMSEGGRNLFIRGNFGRIAQRSGALL